jgi:hypothetical protein
MAQFMTKQNKEHLTEITEMMESLFDGLLQEIDPLVIQST